MLSDLKSDLRVNQGLRTGGKRVTYRYPLNIFTLSLIVSYAFMIVCSLITMSLVSARDRLTRDAIVVESVSTMMLICCFSMAGCFNTWFLAHPSSNVSSKANNN